VKDKITQPAIHSSTNTGASDIERGLAEFKKMRKDAQNALLAGDEENKRGLRASSTMVTTERRGGLLGA